MQLRNLVYSAIMAMVIPLILLDGAMAQPVPDGSKAPSFPQEVCYGESQGVIEFVCKDENAHYRAIDCDEVNPTTRECPSGECTITKGNDCAAIGRSYADYADNEPRCYQCTSIFAPVYGD